MEHVHLHRRGSRWTPFFYGAALFAAAFIAHFPATQAGYIWDDDIQLYRNPFILESGGLYKFWFSTESPDYWPLTSSSFWLEWQIWGDSPTPYHVTNIILHALASVLLWRVLKRLGLHETGALLGGLLFAVHPVTVASAGWIAERKNVLSMVLYLLAILSYLRFEDEARFRWYFFASIVAATALLAKTSVVGLPVVLLLLCWWRRGRVARRDVLRVLPVFLLALLLGLVTIYFQHHNAMAGETVRSEGYPARIAAVGWVICFYLYKLLVPVHLVMIYPRWEIDGSRIMSFLPLALLLAGLGVLWRARHHWGRGALVALGSFIIMLAPVLGFIEMSYANYSLVADHLQYPGMPGIMALIAGGLSAGWLWAQRTKKPAVAVIIATASIAIVVLLAILTWRQAGVFKDQETLWTHNLKYNDQAWMAYLNRGNAYGQRGHLIGAVQDYTQAIELRPKLAEAYSNRGNIFESQGIYVLAIQDYNSAIALKPEYGQAYYNRGKAYVGKGEFAQAIEDFTQAIKFKPGFAEAYNNRGAACQYTGDYVRLVQDCSRAIEIKSGFAEAYGNRAIGFYYLQEYDKAWADVITCQTLGGQSHPEFIKALSDASGRTP